MNYLIPTYSLYFLSSLHIFSRFLLLFISTVILLCSDTILCMISLLSNLLKSALCLRIGFICTWKECVLFFCYYLLECFINVNYFKFIGNVFWIFYTLAVFLSASFIDCLQVSVAVSRYNWEFVCICVWFYQLFSSHAIWSFILNTYNSGCYVFSLNYLSLCNVPFNLEVKYIISMVSLAFFP